jgi:polar amino acid transport system permease protein
MMIVVSISYIVLTGVWTVIQGVLEIKIRAFQSDTPAFTWRDSIKQYLRLTTNDRLLTQEGRQSTQLGRR